MWSTPSEGGVFSKTQETLAAREQRVQPSLVKFLQATERLLMYLRGEKLTWNQR